MISLMRHEVRVRRKTIFWWTVGLAAFGLMYTGFYPSVTDEFRDIDIGSIEVYKAMGVSGMATFEQYMMSTVLNILPLLVGAFGIVLGTGTLAGEEGAGTLELLAALPISRTRLYLAKAAALMVTSALVVVAVSAIITALFVAIESDIDTSVAAVDLFGALLSLWLIAFVFLALGMFVGAFLPSRGSAAAAAAAILVVTFFANNLAQMVSQLERFQPLFPSHYYAKVAAMLTGDVPRGDVLALAVMGVVPLTLGVLAFRRRDLTVGAWPWQRWRRAEGAAPTPARSRRFALPLAVALLALCGCVAVSSLTAVGLSDDLRSNLEDLFGSEEEDTVMLTAARRGRVISVSVSVGDHVEVGDALVELAADEGSTLAPEAQRLLEEAWDALDEIAAGQSVASAEQLQAARESAQEDARAADDSLREVRAEALDEARVEESEARALLAEARLRIADVRLALKDGSISEDDVRAVENALQLAQDQLSTMGTEHERFAVLASVTGTVAEVLVSEGDLVAEGQVLVRLSPRED